MTRATEQADEIHVLWLIPAAWEEEGRVMAQRAPITVAQWLQIIREEEMTVQRLPDGHIAGGPCDGGQVVRVDSDDDTNYFALPPEAIPLLQGVLPAEDYHILLHQSGPRRAW